MKHKAFTYLFFVAVLFIVFQYVDIQKRLIVDTQRIDKLKTKNERLKRERDSLQEKVMDLSYFSLEFDDYAQEYFNDEGYTVEQVKAFVENTMIDNNKVGSDNPLVPLEGMSGNISIDRVKLMNHKWAIIDFTDGTYWGQVLYSYFINEDASLDFEVLASHIYPKID